jgi:DHA1 family tetracycline resistance protein-like MFS transporter
VLGLTFFASGSCQIFVQIFVVGPVVKRLGERGAVLLGVGLGSLSFVIYGLAVKPWMYWLGMPLFAMTGLLQPGLLGLMTRRVDPRHQGQLQGANQSLQGVASMLGPIIFGLTFSWSVRHDATLHQPGLAILVAAALMALAFMLSLRVAHPQTQ